MYTIIDIETTGGNPASEKITEIAVIVHDGQKIVKEFSTLINPEKKIPFHITNLTGITNEMVADAPKFYEVAREIVELTQDCTFVAHNVSFDYQFIKHEYKRLGYDFVRNKLCTVQLSRKLIPGHPSYSLGNICSKLNIEINDRHRAMGDAFATTRLFELLLQLDNQNNYINTSTSGYNKKDLHPALSPEIIDKLPEKTGVYYFYNDQHELIYIGKSRNIRTRIFMHLNNFSTKKAIEMRLNIADIGFEITGSELISLLKESDEIKQYKPLYNRAQRRSVSQFGLFYYNDQKGYIRFTITTTKEREDIPLMVFNSVKSARSYLHSLIDEYELCQKLCGLYPSIGACFHYEIAQCKGACIDKEPANEYNIRAMQVIDLHNYTHESFFILENGRIENELAVVLVRNKKYIGYGYLCGEYYKGDINNLTECLKPYIDNRDVQQIIKNYIRTHSNFQIVPMVN